MNETLKVKVEFGDDVRVVDFYLNPWVSDPPMLSAPSLFAARIGKGNKMHRCSAKAFLFSSVEQAKESVDLKDHNLYATESGILALCLTTQLRNRPARIVGWASNYKGTELGSRQKYHGRLD